MVLNELEHIVIEEKKRDSGNLYIRNALKEYLQAYVLAFIYTSKKYSKNLIFTGGTCLHHFFNLPRLSEDLDFDYQDDFNSKSLLIDLEDYFKKKLKYVELKTSLKQQGSQVVLKFPVLYKLNLADKNESDLLFVKIDLEPNPSRYFSLQITSKSIFGFNFAARHYDLPTLMAGKIYAVLQRKRFDGRDNIETIKGRDYFDLLWFLKNSIKPNLLRLSEMSNINYDLRSVTEQLDFKVKELITKHKRYFEADLVPLISNTGFIKVYVENYYEEYQRFKKILQN
jgi:predicted nucleotidyltransferase component of viral defense system